MNVVRGLRQAAVTVAGSAVVAAVAGGLWAVLRLIGAALSLTGGTLFNRAETSEVRAFLGLGPDHEELDTGEGLTSLGIFLFVSLPLVVAGLLLYGTG
jgi:hypothetical protein